MGGRRSGGPPANSYVAGPNPAHIFEAPQSTNQRACTSYSVLREHTVLRCTKSRALLLLQRRCYARLSTWSRGQLDPPEGLRQAAAQMACAPPPRYAFPAQAAPVAPRRRQGCHTIHRRATGRRRCRREATPAAAPGGGKGGCWARSSKAASSGMVAAGRTRSGTGDMPCAEADGGARWERVGAQC